MNVILSDDLPATPVLAKIAAFKRATAGVAPDAGVGGWGHPGPAYRGRRGPEPACTLILK
jgi:hypothetical protein